MEIHFLFHVDYKMAGNPGPHASKQQQLPVQQVRHFIKGITPKLKRHLVLFQENYYALKLLFFFTFFFFPLLPGFLIVLSLETGVWQLSVAKSLFPSKYRHLYLEYEQTTSWSGILLASKQEDMTFQE